MRHSGRETAFLENGAGWFTTGNPMEAKPTFCPCGRELVNTTASGKTGAEARQLPDAP
jgi:hypothetical protein